MDEVYMDVPAVRNMAQQFGTIGDTLRMVAKVLEGLVNLLNATAFIGLVGGRALAQFIDMIRPHIEQMAEKCTELNTDLDASVDAYERGDQLGATKFH
jgi:hypothetical protein